jgi:hypothetical protein
MDCILLRSASENTVRTVHENIAKDVREGHFAPEVLKYLQSDEGMDSMVFLIGQAPVCVVNVAKYKRPKKINDLEIVILTVFKGYRGSGIATAVIRNVLPGLSAFDVYARCMPSSWLMMQILQKQGFIEISPEVTTRGTLSDNRFFCRPARASS